MKLTDRLDDGDYIKIDGVEYELDLSFDNVLRVHELKDDEEVSNYNKIELMFEMFVIDHEDIELTIEQKVTVIEHILEQHIAKEDVKERVEADYEDNESEQEEEQQKTYDLNKDAEYIYASFLFDYNLDLFEQQGKLHWKKFIALLNGLSKDSAFMQVVNIRTMELPKANKHNQKERQRIKKLKRLYSLEKDKLDNADKAFEHMISAFGGVPQKGR